MRLQRHVHGWSCIVTRRDVLIFFVAAAHVIGCAARPRRDNATTPSAIKPTAVTLAISGMT
jgi:hypothetical protein